MKQFVVQWEWVLGHTLFLGNDDFSHFCEMN